MRLISLLTFATSWCWAFTHTAESTRRTTTTKFQSISAAFADGLALFAPPQDISSHNVIGIKIKGGSQAVLQEEEEDVNANLQSLIDWNTRNLLSFLEQLPQTSRSSLNETEVKQFVTRIAGLYHAENPYHNFEHATHVTQAVRQLLLVPLPKLQRLQSDPLIAFCLTFSALIHDADHVGVPNAQLSKENAPLAHRYANQSIAEHNSIDLAMDLLKEFPALQQELQPYQKDLEYLITKAVLATDIADPTLRADRQVRWQAIFGGTENGSTSTSDSTSTDSDEYLDAQSVLLLELFMQVADVAHTMQDSHTNHLWNERLFAELRKAYQGGRTLSCEEKDPILGWYPGELGFFDYYVLPLARKWEQCCGVTTATTSTEATNGEKGKPQLFGSTSLVEEARRNRQEWEEIGHDMVEELDEKYK